MKKNESTKVTESANVVDEQGNVVPGKNLPVVDEEGNEVPDVSSPAVNEQSNSATKKESADADVARELFKPLTIIPEVMKENNSNTKDIAEKGLDKVVEIAKLGIDHPDAAPFLNEQADRIERMVDGACENGKKNNDAANVIAENYAWTAILLVFTVVSVRLGLKYPESAAKLAKSLFNLPRK